MLIFDANKSVKHCFVLFNFHVVILNNDRSVKTYNLFGNTNKAVALVPLYRLSVGS